MDAILQEMVFGTWASRPSMLCEDQSQHFECWTKDPNAATYSTTKPGARRKFSLSFQNGPSSISLNTLATNIQKFGTMMISTLIVGKLIIGAALS